MKNQKIAVVTGANRSNGLGFHLVQELRHRGYTVVGTYRNPETSGALITLVQEDAGVLALPLDVRDQESVEALSKEVRTCLGRCDILVSNTGIPACREPLHTAPIKQVVEHLEIHAISLVRLTQALLPLMKGGSIIVNISSVLGSLQSMGASYSCYAPAKTAANALAKQLAACLWSAGVIVVSLHPGVFASRIGGAGGPESAARAARNVVARTLSLTMKDSGTFLDAATGQPIPW